MSKVDIVNRALMKLGEPPVSSLNDAVLVKVTKLSMMILRNCCSRLIHGDFRLK